MWEAPSPKVDVLSCGGTVDLGMQAIHSIFPLFRVAKQGLGTHGKGIGRGRDALDAWSVELLRRLPSNSLVKTEVGPAFVRAKRTARSQVTRCFEKSRRALSCVAVHAMRWAPEAARFEFVVKNRGPAWGTGFRTAKRWLRSRMTRPLSLRKPVLFLSGTRRPVNPTSSMCGGTLAPGAGSTAPNWAIVDANLQQCRQV